MAPNTNMFFFRYSILISGYAQKGDVDAAFRVLQEMESHGIAPNAFTYGSLINACAKVLCMNCPVTEFLLFWLFCFNPCVRNVVVCAVLQVSQSLQIVQLYDNAIEYKHLPQCIDLYTQPK